MAQNASPSSLNGGLPPSSRFSPWSLTPVVGAVALVVLAHFGGWSFLEAISPVVLGLIAVGLTVWFLFAVVPKITVHTMWMVDVTLPRGDSAVPAVGTAVRLLTVAFGPAVIYLSLMALREETSTAATFTGAAVLGLVLGALCWRSVVLVDIMLASYPEDEVRKGLLDSGVYREDARKKLKQAAAEISQEGNFDKKRIRLRRLAVTDRVLRNKNYDPNQIQDGTVTNATVAGLGRERDVRKAERERDRVDRESDVEDSRLDAQIAEQKAIEQHFQGLASMDRGREAPSLSKAQRGARALVDYHEGMELIYKARDRAIDKVLDGRSYDELSEDKQRIIENIRDHAERLIEEL